MSETDTQTATGRPHPDDTVSEGERGSRLEAAPSSDTTTWSRPEFELLVVSTFGGGGVHHYTDEQVSRLEDLMSVSKYDMRMPSEGNGVLWMIRGILMGLFAALRFPFRSPPDVVHVHTSHRFSFYRASFYVLFATYVWRVPVVVHVHGSGFDDFVENPSWLVAMLQSRVFRAASDIVVLSDYWRELVAKRADEEKIRVVPNAVDADEFPAEFEVDPPHVVFVSNLFDRKGVRELAAAIDTVSVRYDGNFQVSIAGDGPLSDRVETLADEHDHVSYLGYVSEERKRSLLAEGSVYVLPTYAEGLPIAMLEGMAGGNAVVSTTVGAIPEVIDDTRGVLVEPGDVDALTDALQTLLASPDRCEEMARCNRRAIERYYSWDRAIDELLDIYAQHA